MKAEIKQLFTTVDDKFLELMEAFDGITGAFAETAAELAKQNQLEAAHAMIDRIPLIQPLREQLEGLSRSWEELVGERPAAAPLLAETPTPEKEVEEPVSTPFPAPAVHPRREHTAAEGSGPRVLRKLKGKRGLKIREQYVPIVLKEIERMGGNASPSSLLRRLESDYPEHYQAITNKDAFRATLYNQMKGSHFIEPEGGVWYLTDRGREIIRTES